jgi:hypothetical protein
MESIAGGADYLTPTDFAHALGLSRGETVREWCVEGKVPGAFRVSDKGKGRWRIPRASLGEYVRLRQEEARENQPAASPALRQAQGRSLPGDADSPDDRLTCCAEIGRVYRKKQYDTIRQGLVNDIGARRKSVAQVRAILEDELRRREEGGGERVQNPKSKVQNGWRALKIPA